MQPKLSSIEIILGYQNRVQQPLERQNMPTDPPSTCRPSVRCGILEATLHFLSPSLGPFLFCSSPKTRPTAAATAARLTTI